MSHWRATSQGVVSYRNSTSNHNSRAYPNSLMSLYLIEILHQTTTLATVSPFLLRCILSKFYIKPQLYRHLLSPDSVVSYRNSTSNHNPPKRKAFVPMLYLIEILHQTTTMFAATLSLFRCILSKFYIKPQLCHGACYYTAVVSYRNSTSNHNIRAPIPAMPFVVSYRNSTSNHNPIGDHVTAPSLYLIEILHQTTTRCSQERRKRKLYLIEILHQTTTKGWDLIFIATLYLIEILHQTTTL